MHAIPILMYTSFTIDNKSTDSNSTSINKFEMDIRTLIDNGYAPIRLCDYHYHLSQNDEANEKLFSVIFVGGYENNYTLAFPLLKKYNIQASVFVAIDLVGVYEYPEVPGFTPHFGWKQAQEMIDSRLDDYTDFVFLNRNGSVYNESSLNRALKRIIRDCNTEEFEKSETPPVLLPNFSCHNLRHTFTTRMVEAGVNIKVIQDALGHSDISTTMNIYADATKELKKSEFKGLDYVFR